MGNKSSRAPSSENITLDDKCRMLHITNDSRLQVKFSNCVRVLDRAELDDRDTPDPYEEIAGAFSNYDTFFYENIAVFLDEDDDYDLKLIPEFADICGDVKSINRSNSLRKNIIRTNRTST